MEQKDDSNSISKDTDIWVGYLKSRQTTWVTKNLSFIDFLHTYSKAGRPFQKQNEDHPDNIIWISEEIKSLFCRRFNHDVGKLSRYIKKIPLKFPLDNSVEIGPQIEEIARNLRKFTKPLRDSLDKLDEFKMLDTQVKKDIKNALSEAYIFSLGTALFDDEAIPQNESEKECAEQVSEEQLYLKFLSFIATIMYEPRVYNAYCAYFSKMKMEGFIHFGPIIKFYPLDPQNALKIFRNNVNDKTLIPALTHLKIESNAQLKEDCINIIWQIPSFLPEKSQRKSFINILKQSAEKEDTLGVSKKEINRLLKLNESKSVLKAPKGFLSEMADKSKEAKEAKKAERKKEARDKFKQFDPKQWGL